MDYMGLTQREPEEDSMPIIVLIDEASKTHRSHVLIKKGIEPYAVKTLVNDLREIGHDKFIFKTDQEPAILALKHAIAKELTAGQGDVKRVMMEESPVGESQSNGLIEAAVKTIEGMFRTLKCHIQSKLKQEISADHPIWPWLTEHVAMLHNRYKIGADGKTPRRTP